MRVRVKLMVKILQATIEEYISERLVLQEIAK